MEIEWTDEEGDSKPGRLTVAVLLLIGILVPVLMATYLVFDLTPPFTPGSNTTNGQPSVVVIIPAGVGSNQSLNYEPATLRVVIGVNNTIRWTERDPIPHTVTSLDVPSGSSGFDSENMNKGDSFTVMLSTPGTYQYDCKYHPAWMKGTIVVSAPASSSS
ncbi:MAG: cupredoxin domain-containing protein [Thaumarchaeota archaeon]|nr:cupredoxin domain-containing protein [Nitrososphaerota archaeon]